MTTLLVTAPVTGVINLPATPTDGTSASVVSDGDRPVLRLHDRYTPDQNVKQDSAPDCNQIEYDGNGTTTNPYRVGTIAQLQCIGSKNPSAGYILVSNIGAGETMSWNNDRGFDPIDEFTGTFDGNGYKIENVHIDRPSGENVGLFGSGFSGEIMAISLENIEITGRDTVGGLIGQNNGRVQNAKLSGTVDASSFSEEIGGLAGVNTGTISNSNTSVDVSGRIYIGGLVGRNRGTILNSSAAGTAFSGDVGFVGGLVGQNSGSIAGSSANVSVRSRFDRAGGLVGDNNGNISNSTATGDVSLDSTFGGGLAGTNSGKILDSSASGDVDGGQNIGGLVGNNNAEISNSSASGDVNTGGGVVGGLVGDNNGGTVFFSTATGNVSGREAVGGLVGINRNGTISQAYSTGKADAALEVVGGLAGINTGIINDTYATGRVNDGGLGRCSNVGGLVCRNQGNINRSYWDINTTQQDASAGGTGLTTEEMTGQEAREAMTGFDFRNTWFVPGPNQYPKLRVMREQDIVEVNSVNISVTPMPPTDQTPVSVSANVTPPNASINEFRWTFGDGTMATGRQVVHEFSQAGEYNVSVQIQRDGSTVAIATRTLNVTALNVTETTILGVQTEPRGPLPLAPQINKTVQAFVAAPEGVDRVVFRIGGDNYTDADGSDGWTVEVPVARYEPGTTVTIRAVGADGTADTVTRGLGIASVGGFIGYVLNNADASSTTGSQTDVQPQVVRALPDRTVIRVVWPPPFAPDEAGLNLVITRFGIELEGGIAVVVYTEQGSATEFGGQLAGELEAQPVKIAGTGSLRARNNFSREGERLTIETDSVDLLLTVIGGGIKSFSPTILGYGVEIEFFVGPRASLDGRFNNAAGFPLNVNRGRASLSLEASGDFETDIKAGSLSGSVTGRAGFRKEGGFSVSELLSNITAVGTFIIQGQAELLVFRNSFRETFPVEAPITSANMPEDQGRFELRRQNGTMPLADDEQVATADTGVDSLEGAADPDQPDRLTSDGLADESPSLSATRDGYLLAWDRQPSNKTVLKGHEIYVREASVGGDAAFMPATQVTNDTRVDVDPDLATNGSGGALLVWTRLNRTFDNRSQATPNRTFAAQEIAVATAATAENQTRDNWTTPTTLTNASGAAFRPRVGHATGQYYIAWRYDTDGQPRTFGDGGVRVAAYDTATVSLGPVTTFEGATVPQVAGGRLAFFQPDATGSRNGTVVVRNLSTGTQRTTSATGFKDLAISANAVAWVTGEGPEEEIHYWRANGSVGSAPTQTVSATNDIELVTRQVSSGEQVDVLVFDGRRVTGNDTEGSTKLYYRIRHDDSWGPSRPLTTGGTDLTFLDVAAVGRDGAFRTVSSAENVSAPAEMPDLFSIRHSYRADLTVSADLTAPRNITPGEQVQLDWQVQNTGASSARNVTVLIEDSTGVIQRISGGALAEIPPGGSVDQRVQFPANRSRNLTVRVTEASDGSRRSSDTVGLRLMRPDLRLGTVEQSPATGGVAYTTTVRNEGPVTARDVTPGITNNRRLVANASIGDLSPNESATVRLIAPTNRTNAGLVTRIKADPGDRIEEINETTGTQRVVPPRPNLFVSTVAVRGVIDEPAGRTQLNITVGNRGFAGSVALVNVTAGDQTITRRISLAGTAANASRFRTVQLSGDALSLSPGERIIVEVRPNTLDAQPVDNVVSVTPQDIDPNPEFGDDGDDGGNGGDGTDTTSPAPPRGIGLDRVVLAVAVLVLLLAGLLAGRRIRQE